MHRSETRRRGERSRRTRAKRCRARAAQAHSRCLRLTPDGVFELSSDGAAFGDVGFYRVQSRSKQRLRVWRIRSLKEHFRVYVDDADVLRCDHGVRFLGLRVLHLHYRIEPLREADAG